MARRKAVNQWTEEVFNIPAEIGAAAGADRSELLVVWKAKPRRFTLQECKGLVELIRVLMDTNRELRLRCTQAETLNDFDENALREFRIQLSHLVGDVAGYLEKRGEDDDGGEG